MQYQSKAMESQSLCDTGPVNSTLSSRQIQNVRSLLTNEYVNSLSNIILFTAFYEHTCDCVASGAFTVGLAIARASNLCKWQPQLSPKILFWDT